MQDVKLRNFIYRCRCGYTVNVFIDFGVPQQFYKCRKCGTSVERKEL